jgi:hypothetical protein
MAASRAAVSNLAMAARHGRFKARTRAYRTYIGADIFELAAFRRVYTPATFRFRQLMYLDKTKILPQVQNYCPKSIYLHIKICLDTSNFDNEFKLEGVLIFGQR